MFSLKNLDNSQSFIPPNMEIITLDGEIISFFGGLLCSLALVLVACRLRRTTHITVE
jgi:hypothetical protein